MHPFKVGLLLVALASIVHAAPQRVALYPAMDIDTYRAIRSRLIDDPLGENYLALPKCRTGALPCRLVVRSSPKVYRAGTLADGACDVTIIFPPARTQNGRYKILDGCKVVLSKSRALAMPPHPFQPSPLVGGITFPPDLGDTLGGIDAEVQLPGGFQTQRMRWVRASTKKNQSNTRVTRNIRGAVFTEKFKSFWIEPRVSVDSFIDQKTVGAGYEVFQVYQDYYWHNAPFGSPGCPTCELYSNQYQIKNEGLTGWWRRTDHKKDHWEDAIAVMGIRLAYSFGCSVGGNLPTGTSGNCTTRAMSIGITPIF